MKVIHVRESSMDDGGCMVCDECDLGPDHEGRCDCYCYHDNPSHPFQHPHCLCLESKE